jgi:hypothetical protein
MAESRTQHVADERGANGGIEAKATGLRTLDADSREGDYRQDEGTNREDDPEWSTNRHRLTSEHECECGGSTDAEQDQTQAQEADKPSCAIDCPRPSLFIEHLTDDARSTRTRLSDMEHVRATDGMRVSRYDSPCDGVCAMRKIGRQPDRHGPRVGTCRPAIVNPAGRAVIDTNGTESRLDGFVEREHDLLGSASNYLVIRWRR